MQRRLDWLAAFALAGAVLPAHAAPDTASTQAKPAAADCRICAAGRQTVGDARDVLTAPVRWRKPEWRSAARKAIIVAGVMAFADRPLRDSAQRRRSDATDRLADAFEPFGERYAAGVLAGYWLAGHFGHHPEAQTIARDGLESAVIAAGIIVPGLKFVTGRSRPRTDQGTSDFHPFNGGQSFPSGHTAAAFTVAASIAQNDDRPWVKGLAYGIASLVGYARIDHDAHFASDVTAGAFIGIGVAKRVAALNRQHRGFAWVPVHDATGWRVAVSRSF